MLFLARELLNLTATAIFTAALCLLTLGAFSLH